MHKNDAFDAKIVNTRLTKIFIAIFAPDERLPSSATLDMWDKKDKEGRIFWSVDFAGLLVVFKFPELRL